MYYMKILFRIGIVSMYQKELTHYRLSILRYGGPNGGVLKTANLKRSKSLVISSFWVRA